MPQKGIRGSNPRLSAIFPNRTCKGIRIFGGVAEWSKAAVSKTVIPAFPVSRVRIPTPPPSVVVAPHLDIQSLKAARRRAFRLFMPICGTTTTEKNIRILVVGRSQLLQFSCESKALKTLNRLSYFCPPLQRLLLRVPSRVRSVAFSRNLSSARS